MAALKVLSIAVATGRAGYVYLQGSTLLDWGVAVKAIRNTTEFAGYVQDLILKLKPDVLVTERCDDRSRKGEKSIRLIRAVAELASHNTVLDVSVPRPRTYPSRYEEAKALARRYPEVAGYAPDQKCPVYSAEARGMILFEALALAERVIFGPPEALAAAMG